MDNVPYNDRAAPPPPLAIVQTRSAAQSGAQSGAQQPKIPKPEIKIIANGEQVVKPGMKSVFVDDDRIEPTTAGEFTIRGGSYCSCNSVTICTCNTVCTCESVCTCQAVCSCVGNCTCNQVCTCNNHCTCDRVCTCNSQCTCQSHRTGGTTYCSCVPVH